MSSIWISASGVFSKDGDSFVNTNWADFVNEPELVITSSDGSTPKSLHQIDIDEVDVMSLAVKVRGILSECHLPFRGDRTMVSSPQRSKVVDSIVAASNDSSISNLDDIIINACLMIAHEAFISTIVIRQSRKNSVKPQRASRYRGVSEVIEDDAVAVIENTSVRTLADKTEFIYTLVKYLDNQGLNLSAIINIVYGIAASEEIELIKAGESDMPLSLEKGDKCEKSGRDMIYLLPDGVLSQV